MREFNPEIFQTNLAFYRKRKGLTQEELGAMVGIDRYNIGRYETGHSMPKIEALVKIASILEISMDILFFESNNDRNAVHDHKANYVIPENPVTTDEIRILKNYIQLLEKNLDECNEFKKSILAKDNKYRQKK